MPGGRQVHLNVHAYAQAYEIPNIDLDLKLVRTNLAPRTIVRGPGFLNSVMIIEQVPPSC
jgi:CO/xanthine dehydrogenase Mo-binding subunit